MTADQFNMLCLEHCIDPELALDNEDIRTALKTGNYAEVVRILVNDF